jgi:hypothetical protein
MPLPGVFSVIADFAKPLNGCRVSLLNDGRDGAEILYPPLDVCYMGCYGVSRKPWGLLLLLA